MSNLNRSAFQGLPIYSEIKRKIATPDFWGFIIGSLLIAFACRLIILIVFHIHVSQNTFGVVYFLFLLFTGFGKITLKLWLEHSGNDEGKIPFHVKFKHMLGKPVTWLSLVEKCLIAFFLCNFAGWFFIITGLVFFPDMLINLLKDYLIVKPLYMNSSNSPALNEEEKAQTAIKAKAKLVRLAYEMQNIIHGLEKTVIRVRLEGGTQSLINSMLQGCKEVVALESQRSRLVSLVKSSELSTRVGRLYYTPDSTMQRVERVRRFAKGAGAGKASLFEVGGTRSKKS